MNTASRMESTCQPGRIHVSAATKQLLQHERWQATGGVMVKGKGMMETYLWEQPGFNPKPIEHHSSKPTGVANSAEVPALLSVDVCGQGPDTTPLILSDSVDNFHQEADYGGLALPNAYPAVRMGGYGNDYSGMYPSNHDAGYEQATTSHYDASGGDGQNARLVSAEVAGGMVTPPLPASPAQGRMASRQEAFTSCGYDLSSGSLPKLPQLAVNSLQQGPFL